MVLVSSFAREVLSLLVWLALLIAVFVPLERLFAVRPQKVLRQAVWTDLGFYFFSSLTVFVLVAGPLAVLAVTLRRLSPSFLQTWSADLPLAARLALVLVIGEIGFYWGHRLSHKIPLLWRFHQVHHSAEALDWLVNTRAHPIDMVFIRLCGLVPLYVLGLGSQGAATAVLLLVVWNTAWNFFIHANIRWRFGWLESVVATPAFHHWHHTRFDHIDHNYASTLPWLDRVFGTWYVPRHWPEAYGVAEPISGGLGALLIEPLMARQRRPGPPSPPVQSGLPALPAAGPRPPA